MQASMQHASKHAKEGPACMAHEELAGARMLTPYPMANANASAHKLGAAEINANCSKESCWQEPVQMFGFGKVAHITCKQAHL